MLPRSLAYAAVLLLLLGCSKKAHIAPPHPIERSTWAAIEDSPGHWRIFVRDAQAQSEAVRELCPKHAYVCTVPEEVGKIMTLERVRK